MEKILTDLRKRDIPVPEMARKERAPSDAMGLGEPVRERDTSRQARPEAPVWQRPASNPDGTAWHPAGNN